MTTPEGRKNDKGKPRYSLLPVKALRRVVEVLEFGAQTYGVGNWMFVENASGPDGRYINALMRHVEAWRGGERLDPDSGHPHLAHIVCNALFLLWFEGEK